MADIDDLLDDFEDVLRTEKQHMTKQHADMPRTRTVKRRVPATSMLGARTGNMHTVAMKSVGYSGGGGGREDDARVPAFSDSSSTSTSSSTYPHTNVGDDLSDLLDLDTSETLIGGSVCCHSLGCMYVMTYVRMYVIIYIHLCVECVPFDV